MNPKSPQSSPVKRAKRARLPRKMWLIDIPGCAPCAHDIRTYQEDVPVHVLDASEAAHEERVEAGAKALYGSGLSIKAWRETHESLKNHHRVQARAFLASVYSAPAGKGSMLDKPKH